MEYTAPYTPAQNGVSERFNPYAHMRGSRTDRQRTDYLQTSRDHRREYLAPSILSHPKRQPVHREMLHEIDRFWYTPKHGPKQPFVYINQLL